MDKDASSFPLFKVYMALFFSRKQKVKFLIQSLYFTAILSCAMQLLLIFKYAINVHYERTRKLKF